MNKKLRKFLEQNGLRAEASEKEAWELYDELKGKGIELIGVDPGQRSDTGGTPGGNVPAGDGNQPAATEPQDGRRSYSKEELDNIVAAQTVQALTREATRRTEVQDMIDVSGVGSIDNGTFARSILDNPEIDRARASQLIFAELKKRNQPIGVGAHVGTEGREKSRDAVRDGLLLRSGVRLEKPAAGANEFRGRHMVEICREMLELAGVSCRGLSNQQIASRAIASGSTSDLPMLFSSLVNRSLLGAYDESPATWRPIVAVGTANDFRTMHAVKLSGAPDLQGINENGEYKTANFADSGEWYRVVRKGIKVPFTFEMIINDDLRGLTRVPQLFGASARRMEADAVYSLITTNGVMSDNVALFHATHKNLAGTAGAPSSDTFSVARAAMRKQKGLNGERIDVVPAYVLTPTVYETSIDILLTSAALPTAEMSSGVNNPWRGKLTPVSDPRLDDVSPTAWYMFASPNQAPVIEVAWLEGYEQPFVDENMDFNSDAMIIKVRHCFGAGVVDHVGGYKNAGQ